MKLLKGIFTCLMGMLALTLIIAGLIVWQSYRFWWQFGSESIVVQVESGSSSKNIAQELKDQEVIASAFWFQIYTKLDSSTRDFKAGIFEIPAGDSYAAIVDLLTTSEAGEVSITIPEGYTLDQIGELVMSNFDVTPEEWVLWTGPDSPLEGHDFLAQAKPDEQDLEGYLFPDTYRFFKDATVQQIVTTLVDHMASQYQSLNFTDDTHEILTLASIVQREVMSPEEMANVANIFLNRLEVGMALQADSTVNYVTGKDTPAISLSDRDLDSLYNTYQYPGLPPGPISNPGLDALKAVRYPAENDYFYFLTSPEGEVFYATTHDEHLVNKNLHLR